MNKSTWTVGGSDSKAMLAMKGKANGFYKNRFVVGLKMAESSIYFKDLFLNFFY